MSENKYAVKAGIPLKKINQWIKIIYNKNNLFEYIEIDTNKSKDFKDAVEGGKFDPKEISIISSLKAKIFVNEPIVSFFENELIVKLRVNAELIVNSTSKDRQYVYCAADVILPITVEITDAFTLFEYISKLSTENENKKDFLKGLFPKGKPIDNYLLPKFLYQMFARVENLVFDVPDFQKKYNLNLKDLIEKFFNFSLSPRTLLFSFELPFSKDILKLKYQYESFEWLPSGEDIVLGFAFTNAEKDVINTIDLVRLNRTLNLETRYRDYKQDESKGSEGYWDNIYKKVADCRGLEMNFELSGDFVSSLFERGLNDATRLSINEKLSTKAKLKDEEQKFDIETLKIILEKEPVNRLYAQMRISLFGLPDLKAHFNLKPIKLSVLGDEEFITKNKHLVGFSYDIFNMDVEKSNIWGDIFYSVADFFAIIFSTVNSFTFFQDELDSWAPRRKIPRESAATEKEIESTPQLPSIIKTPYLTNDGVHSTAFHIEELTIDSGKLVIWSNFDSVYKEPDIYIDSAIINNLNLTVEKGKVKALGIFGFADNFFHSKDFELKIWWRIYNEENLLIWEDRNNLWKHEGKAWINLYNLTSKFSFMDFITGKKLRLDLYIYREEIGKKDDKQFVYQTDAYFTIHRPVISIFKYASAIVSSIIDKFTFTKDFGDKGTGMKGK